MNTLTLCRAGLIALALGAGVSFGSAQAASPTLDFRLGIDAAPNAYACYSNRQIVRALRNHGFSNVAIVRDLARNRVLAVGSTKGKWYQMRVDTCSGRVDNIRRIYRNNHGDFTFYLDFGDGRSPGRDHGNDDHGHGDDNGGYGNNPGGHGSNDDPLVCLVTFFDESQVAGGADANVERARLLPLSEAQDRDRPNDRNRIFDYGTDEQNRQTCDYLNSLNN